MRCVCVRSCLRLRLLRLLLLLRCLPAGLRFCTCVLVQFLFCRFWFSLFSFSFSFSFQHGLTQQRRVTGEGCIRDRDVSLSVQVRKTHLCRHLIRKMIFSPRQARDKHTENSKQRCAFSQAPDERHEGLRQRHPPVKRPGQLC